MDLELGSEHALLLSSVEPLLARYRMLPQPQGPDYYVYGEQLQAELEASGFYGTADGLDLDRFSAALLLGELAKLPYAVPAMAPLLVAPALGIHLEGPVALMSSPGAVTRFLPQARTALIDMGDKVASYELAVGEVVADTTIFAYPYGRLKELDETKLRPLAASPAELRAAWRLGLVYEILGALRASLALTVDYVKQRAQFKRLIGSFQAVQHRLAEAATRIEGLNLLAARAALSGDKGEIGLAATYAQQIIPQIVYDCHQFHGAMGVTLEYTLHHWTYRLKVLAGELGGASAAGRSATQALWGEAA